MKKEKTTKQENKKEHKYVYAGKTYTWDELVKMLLKLEEKKKKGCQKRLINGYSYSAGFSEGMLYGVQLIVNDKEYKIK